MSIRSMCAVSLFFASLSLGLAADYPGVPAASAADQRGYTYIAGVLTAASGGHAAGAVYAARIDPSGGNRLYTSYLDLSGARVTGAAVDQDGNLFVTGGAQKTAGGSLDAFVAKLDPKGQSWLFTTYLGGSADDLANGIAVDSLGHAYITGWTNSADFPLRNPALSTRSGSPTGFLAEISADGGTVLYASYLGNGAARSGNGIAVDSTGAVYVAGGGTQAFLMKTTTDGASPQYIQALDGSEATSIALDGAGNVYVAGSGPVFAAKFNPAGERIYYTSIITPIQWTPTLGADGASVPRIAVDSSGNAYVMSGYVMSGQVVKLSPAGERQAASPTLPSGSPTLLAAIASGRVSMCSLWLSQSSAAIPAEGGAASIAVQTASDCDWRSAASAPWVEVSGSAGALSYRVAPNNGPARTATIAVGGETVTVTQAAGASFPGAVRDNPGFRLSSLASCDDCSSPQAVDLGFPVDFYGRNYSQVWVNANGNITFDAPGSAYSPQSLASLKSPMIAPFWADVDTRNAGAIQYGADMVDGHPAFGVTWTDIGPYAGHGENRNTFQVVLIDRSDIGPGQFDIEMNYAGMTWDTGEASGDASARAGFSNGTGQAGTWIELEGSGVSGGLLHGGRYTFTVRPTSSTTAAATVSSAASAPATASKVLPAAIVKPEPRQQAVGTITEYRVPITGTEPVAIAAGPDGALWFTDWAGFIGRATTVGAITEFPDAASNPGSIVTGPDGALWFTDTGNSKIGRATTSGAITEYATPTTGSAPHFITVGSDGNLWFTEYNVGKIGRITPAGVITEFPLPHAYDNPEGITSGPDGNLWFAAYNVSSNYIGRITTAGAVTPFTIPTGSSGPLGIATGPDNNLWFTEYAGNKIGKITTAGGITEYSLSSSASQPYSIVAGPDGALWFTQRNTFQIGTITIGGTVTEYPVPTTNSYPIGIAVGSDNAIWFTESNTGKIGRIATAVTNPPSLSIAKGHTGNFTPGQQGATYTVTVSNAAGAGATSGTVTVTESLPAGLTLVSMAGTGWSCGNPVNTCNRSDALTGGTSYAAITVTANVSSAALSPQVNFVSVAGGGTSAVATASDSTVIDSAPSLGTITEYRVPITSTEPVGITAGPDGALWFTDWAGFIGRMTTAGSVTEIPDAATNPASIVTGPDGALWFADTGNSKIGRITTSGIISEYATPTTGSAPNDIIVGPDGNLWFTEYNVGKIAKITPAGVITEYPLYHSYDNPEGITVGPDGALWYAAFNVSSNYIGRITTAGTLSAFEIPTGSSGPVGIATGPDGNLWFTEYAANKIGQMTTSGVFTEYPISSASSQPDGLVVGPDGALWFTQHNSFQIGRITTTGLITEYAVPTTNSYPVGIAVGSDGAIWFTETNTGRIGRIVAGITDPPVLSIAKSHTGDFMVGQQGATYTVTVSNAAAASATSGTVTVTESLPAGLTLVSMAGTGWSCGNPVNTCSRSDALTAGTSYPAITVAVNVAATATTPQVNFVSVAGGGTSAVATASDSTVIDSGPSLGTTTEYRVPITSTAPHGITAGPDGALWFTDWAGFIGRMTTAGSVTEVPDAATNPASIVTGPDGALWFTDTGNSKIGRITTSGIISEYSTPTTGSAPNDIIVGPDGNLWFTEYNVGKIGKITPAGVITEYPLYHSYDNPEGITVGPDGALWFAAYNVSSNYIGRITTAGALSAFEIPTGSSGPVGIATGPDGNLWFTEYAANKIGQMTTSGVFTEYAISSASSQPDGLVVGPDGALWFTQHNTFQIGRITTTGLITEYPVPTTNSYPIGIAVGSDGAIWFTETNTGKIGRIATGYTDPPVLTVSVSHIGYFTPPQQGATYTVTVSNLAGTGATNGMVTVTESLTSGLTLVSMSGIGWSCLSGESNCTRTDPLAAGSSYPTITVTVNVGATASSPQVNTVSASGGLSAAASASDAAIVTAVAPSVGTITEYKPTTAGSGPHHIVTGPDGALWFTEFKVSRIGRLTTAGTFTEFTVPTAGSGPAGITVGPDGALWFAEYNTNRIGTVSTGGTFHEYPIPTAGSNPLSIVTGPDQNIWFTEYGTGKVGKITTQGVITEYPLYHSYDNPEEITVGPDGALWFAAFNVSSNYIGRLTTAGGLSGYDIPTGSSGPVGIVTGPDGNLWFTEYAGNKIGKVTVDGVFTEFGVASSGSNPHQIVPGPDGALWFTQFGTNQIGRITTTGLVTEYPIPTATSEPIGITVGPDSEIWFAEYNGNKIGRTLAPGPVVPVLSITSTHSGNFMPGQMGATYSVTVSNATGAAVTSNAVTVTEAIPLGLSLVSMAGSGWTCPSGGSACTRSDALPASTSYPPIVVTANVTATQAEQVINQVSVTAVSLPTSNATDPTVIGAFSPCDVNQAGATTVVDVQLVINQALGLAAMANDINRDGRVDVVDVEIVVIAVFGLGCV